jgi:hypothetical protein
MAERPSNPASGTCPCTFQLSLPRRSLTQAGAFQRFSVSLVLPLNFCLLPPRFRFQDFSVSVFQRFNFCFLLSTFCFSQSVALALFARTPNRHLFRNFILTPT